MNILLGQRVKIRSELHGDGTAIVLIEQPEFVYVGWDNPKKHLGDWLNKAKTEIEIIRYCEYDERLVHSNKMVRSRTAHCYADLIVPRVGDRIQYVGAGDPFMAVVLKVQPKFTKEPIFVIATDELLHLFIPDSQIIHQIGPFCLKKVERMSKEEMLTHNLPEVRRLVTSKKRLRTML